MDKTIKTPQAIQSASTDITFCLTTTCRNMHCDRNPKGHLHEVAISCSRYNSYADCQLPTA